MVVVVYWGDMLELLGLFVSSNTRNLCCINESASLSLSPSVLYGCLLQYMWVSFAVQPQFINCRWSDGAPANAEA
jgi:hypothetical protein